MAGLESDLHALRLDATSRSRAISDENETEAVALGGGLGSYTDANHELNLKREDKLAAADDQAGVQSISEQDAVILVMGATGAGKSSFINCLTDCDVKIGHGLKSCTSKVEIYPLISRNRTTFLVDTPGFDGTDQTASEVLQEIASFLYQTYANGIKIAGIIYLHRITDHRMVGTSMRSLRLLKALCGNTLLSSLVLATSIWDHLSGSKDHRTAGLREEALQTNLTWKYMLELGATMYRYDNTKEAALRIVDHIQSLERDMNLEIQKEMMQQNCRLDQTLAGQLVQKDLIDAIKYHEKKLLELQNTYAEAVRARDLKLVECIENESRPHVEMIAKLNETAKGLHLEFGGLKEERQSRYQDEVDRLELLELEKSTQKTKKHVSQKHQARVKASHRNPPGAKETQSEVKNSKRPAAAVVDLVFREYQAASFFGGFPMDTDTFVTRVGNSKMIQPLPAKTENYEEQLRTTSTDIGKKQDQRDTHGRTPNDSELSSICSEEPWLATNPRRRPENLVKNRASATTCCRSMAARRLQKPKVFNTLRGALKGAVPRQTHPCQKMRQTGETIVTWNMMYINFISATLVDY